MSLTFPEVQAPVIDATGPDAPDLRERITDKSASQTVEDRTRFRVQNAGAGGQERVALLGVLLAQLETVNLRDTARLLSVKEPALVRLMRGEESIPSSKVERWEVLSDALRCLHSILEATATERWLNAPIRALGGDTPLQAISKGRYRDVQAVTRGYLQGSPTGL